jgi:protoheme IX farnesyltransferase
MPLSSARRAFAIGDYIALTKPRLNLLVVLTSAAGYYLGASTPIRVLPMAQAVLGTALVASGAAVLNQLYERDTDRLMRRTRLRPLPDGRVGPTEAGIFGAVLSLAGLALLALAANAIATLLALATIVVYLMVYTPMKRRSSLSTLVGAIPGALPPLIGWAAARGGLSVGGWTLFGIVFLWQIPHFMAIAWMYRQDYSRAGYLILPRGEKGGSLMSWQTMAASFALMPVTLSPALIGGAEYAYSFLACLLSAGCFYYSFCLASRRTNLAARRLLAASIVYLPMAFFFMALNKV